MPEGEKLWGGGQYYVIGGDNLPSPVGIGLTDPANIGGPAGSDITGHVNTITISKTSCFINHPDMLIYKTSSAISDFSFKVYIL